MRPLLLALLLLLLPLAGCVKNAPVDPAATAPRTNATNATVPVMASKEVFSQMHDFAPNGPPADPTNPQAPVAAKATVPAGYATIALNVTWTFDQGAPAFAGNGVAVKLLDASKKVVATCAGPSPGDQAPPKPCAAKGGSAPAAGDWSVQYEGMGDASAKVSVVVG